MSRCRQSRYVLQDRDLVRNCKCSVCQSECSHPTSTCLRHEGLYGLHDDLDGFDAMFVDESSSPDSDLDQDTFADDDINNNPSDNSDSDSPSDSSSDDDEKEVSEQKIVQFSRELLELVTQDQMTNNPNKVPEYLPFPAG